MLGLSNGLMSECSLGESFSPTDVSGLLTWYKNGDAAGDGSGWTDSSGNDNHATTGSADGTNVEGGISFDGSGQYLSTSITATQYTIFTVVKMDIPKDGSGNHIKTNIILGNTSGKTANFLKFFDDNASVDSQYFYTKDSSVQKYIASAESGDETANDILKDGVKQVITWVRTDAGAFQLYVDGTLIDETTTTTFNETTFNTLSHNSNFSMEDVLYEVVAYDNELSASDRVAVWTDIKSRNGL